MTTWTLPTHAAYAPPPPPPADDASSDEGLDDTSSATESPPQPVPSPPQPFPDDGPRPRAAPTWMWGGLGVSAGLTVGMGVSLGLLRARLDRLTRDLRDEAFASLQDDRPGNDVDPNASDPLTGAPIDLCQAARRQPSGEPGTVTNARITRVCNQGDTTRRATTATAVAMGMFAASTITFGVLLGVRRHSPRVEHAMRYHGLAFGVAPTVEGVTVGTRFHF